MAQTTWPDAEARQTFLMSMAALVDGTPRRSFAGRPLATALTLTLGVLIATAIR